MRLHPLVLVVPLLLGAAACGSDAKTTSPPAPRTGAATSAPVTSSPATASGAPVAGGSKVLLGTVGTPANPEEFTIGMTTEDGTKLESIPAGTYTLKVDDQATMHDFHLMGDGVDVTTGVSAKENRSFEITLKPGKYTFQCDPHSDSMNGSFTVT